ncbi:LOW QUALITY PROTEIN: vang-like protein 1 [Rhinophrynus dorsalis]
MDTESNQSGYSYHSRHHHREKSQDSLKSVTIQTAAGEALLGDDSGRGEEEDAEQDDRWGETTTAVTSERSASLEEMTQSRGSGHAQVLGPSTRTMVGFYMACTLALFSFLTPPAFILLPQVLWGSELEPCGVVCEGLYISVAFKLLILVLASWAVFFRPSRSALPRLVTFHALLLVLLIIFLSSYWLFYGVRVLGTHERNLLDVVQYATSLVDALIFIHYLAVILLEIRHLRPFYFLTVVRSSDGEARFYSLGALSIQNAALFVLENYYKDFHVFNPSIPISKKSTRREQHCGVKLYTVDGPDNSTVSQSQSMVSGSSNYKERYYEEVEHARKVRRRKARMVVAVHEAFFQLKRLAEKDEEWKDPHMLHPREAAQSIFPLIAKSLQRYLRTTHQTHLYTMEGIIQHLTVGITHSMSPQAFLEQYLHAGPPILFPDSPSATWTLVSEESVTRPRSELTFSLQSSDTQLVVSVSGIPFLSLSETFIPPNSHQFMVSSQPENNLLLDPL